MPSGLIALLDDVATIAKLAASSLDDVAGAAGKASTKAAGVVIDDTAVTPRYVIGLAPERELPTIGKIAWGSLKNKVLLLLPAALLLTAVAPVAVAVAITAGVYGVVALIVKLDDIGLHMAQRGNRSARIAGAALVHAVPKMLTALSGIGTAAMIP